MNGVIQKDAGITLVLANSGEWKDLALENLNDWLQWKKSQGVCEVTLEEFKVDFLNWVKAMPHHPNCWGAITRSAACRGWIRKTGRMANMKLPAAHARDASIWEIA